MSSVFSPPTIRINTITTPDPAINWPLWQLLSYWLYAAGCSDSCSPLFHFHDLHFPRSSTPPIPRPCNYSPFWLSHCLHSTSCLLFPVLHCLLKQCPRGLLLLRLQSCTVRHRATIPSQRLYRTVLQLALSVSYSLPASFQVQALRIKIYFHYLWPLASSLLYSVNFSITNHTILIRPIDFSIPWRWQQC